MTLFQVTKTENSKYYITDGVNNYIVLTKDTSTPSLIYDEIYDEEISKYKWYYMSKIGYYYCKKLEEYFHQTIMRLAKVTKNEAKTTIDHINQCKTDNRLSNLRYVDNSDQTSNRVRRKDKLPPLQELIDIRITQYPKYIRFDKTELKFVIEKYPGQPKCISGTKSSKVSIYYKYLHILEKLKELDENYTDLKDFEEKTKKLYIEYCDIIKITSNETFTSKEFSYNYDDDIEKLKTYLSDIDDNYKDKRNINESLPKYVCYKEAKGNRGDLYYISRMHPILKAYGFTSDLKSSSSTKKSTIRKEKEILQKLRIIENLFSVDNTNPNISFVLD